MKVQYFQNGHIDQQVIDMLNTITYNSDMDSKDIYHAKHGGNLDYFKNGKKIHIKESQKGSFTKYCGGNVTSECIARGKASPDPRIRKKATFADNARKWKHQWGGMLHKPEVEDELTGYGPEYWANIKIDPDSLNPYGAYKFGLPAYNDKYYVGKKSGNPTLQQHEDVVRDVYTQLRTAIKASFPQYSEQQIDQLADSMTRHYIGENGWTPTSKVRRFGGFGKARSIAAWVTGMKEWYPKSMSSSNYRGYIEGLKSNKEGNRYNSEYPGNTYYDKLFRDFGPNTRVDKLLNKVK